MEANVVKKVKVKVLIVKYTIPFAQNLQINQLTRIFRKFGCKTPKMTGKYGIGKDQILTTENIDFEVVPMVQSEDLPSNQVQTCHPAKTP